MPPPRYKALLPTLAAAALLACKSAVSAARPGPAVVEGWAGSQLPPAAISLSAPPPTPSAAPAIRVAPGGTHLLAPGAPDNAPPLYLTGLNWFGFENGHTFFDGLWAGESALTRDFEVVAWRIRLLGFNAIRVPFSFPDLDAPPSNISASPCTATTVESVAASVARAGWGGLGGGVVVPALFDDYRPLGPSTPSTPCNTAAPTDSSRTRFLWALSTLARAGFYLVLDNHLQYDKTLVEAPDAWVAAWADLAAQLAADPVLAPVTMLDLANEPDCLGLGWGPSPTAPTSKAGDAFPGMATMYHRAAAAVHAAHPAALVIIEGTGQVSAGLANNWGDGYATEPAAGGDVSAAAFFNAAGTAAYAANLVLGPHLYPSSISQRAAGAGDGGPAGLASRLDTSFGRLTMLPGFCAAGGGDAPQTTACRAYPWLVGEVGARAVADAGDSPFLEALADYAGRPTPPPAFGGGTAAQPDAAGLALSPSTHAPAGGLFWWSWNANSGDTGGLVGEDWAAVDWAKIDWLKAAAGLVPWADGVVSRGGGGEGGEPAAPTPTVPPPLPTPPADLTAALAWLAESAVGTAPGASPLPGLPLLQALAEAPGVPGGGAGSPAPSPSPPPGPGAALAARLATAAALPLSTAVTLLATYAINLLATAGGLAGPGRAPGAPPPYVCLAVAGTRPGRNGTRVDLALAASAEVCAPYLIEVASPAYAAAAWAWNWRPLLEAGGGGAVGPGGRVTGVAAGAWQGLGPAQTAAGVAVEVVLDGGGDAYPTAVAVNGVPCAVVWA